jgi:hypothetical protein
MVRFLTMSDHSRLGCACRFELRREGEAMKHDSNHGNYNDPRKARFVLTPQERLAQAGIFVWLVGIAFTMADPFLLWCVFQIATDHPERATSQWALFAGGQILFLWSGFLLVRGLRQARREAENRLS